MSEATTGLWARLFPAAKAFLRPMPRAGAWYPVVRELDGRLVVEVAMRRVAVPSTLLEVRDTRPTRFSVVRRPVDAPPTPDDLGRVYSVCPSCGARAALFGEPAIRVCNECGHRGELAWWETG